MRYIQTWARQWRNNRACKADGRCGGPKICPTLFLKSFLGGRGGPFGILARGPTATLLRHWGPNFTSFHFLLFSDVLLWVCIYSDAGTRTRNPKVYTLGKRPRRRGNVFLHARCRILPLPCTAPPHFTLPQKCPLPWDRGIWSMDRHAWFPGPTRRSVQ